MIERIEDSLNGGYRGLYGEVVWEDSYKLRSVTFQPDIVLDFGANVGIFTRLAREMFPGCKVIAVEPDKANCEIFRQFTNDPNVTLIEKAIGKGMIWKCEQNINGAHESYLSSGLGYPFYVGENMENINETTVEAVMPDEIINQYCKDGMKVICKIDIEGAENIIWGHESSMQLLRKMDFIAIELHWNALTGNLRDEVREKTLAALKSFEKTHQCTQDNIYFHAIKKQYADTTQVRTTSADGMAQTATDCS